jgi:hypothetical protein
MAKSVKFASDEFVNDARDESLLHSRSLAGQIMHWARIGRAIDRSGSFDYGKVLQALSGQIETTTLTAAEKAVWSEGFLEKMSEPGPEEGSYFADLRKSGKAVGVDASGNIVIADTQTDG